MNTTFCTDLTRTCHTSNILLPIFCFSFSFHSFVSPFFRFWCVQIFYLFQLSARACARTYAQARPVKTTRKWEFLWHLTEQLCYVCHCHQKGEIFDLLSHIVLCISFRYYVTERGNWLEIDREEENWNALRYDRSKQIFAYFCNCVPFMFITFI